MAIAASVTAPDFLSAIGASFEALGATDCECRLIVREARDTKVEGLVRSLLQNHIRDQGHIAHAGSHKDCIWEDDRSLQTD